MSLQYKIPQNVEREDQILSFLTFRQLGILAAGGAFCYFLYIILAPIFYVEIWGPIVFIPAALTACVAFLNIGGVSFSKWFLLFIEFVVNPKKRIWNNKKSFAYTIQAIMSAPSKKTNDKKKLPQTKGMITPKQPRTMSELLQDIEGAERHDSSIFPMSLPDDGPLDEKEKLKHEKLMELMEQQKKVGVFAPIPKKDVILVQQESVSLDVKGEADKINQETSNKIQQVRPETIQQVSSEEIIKSNMEKFDMVRQQTANSKQQRFSGK